MTTILVSGASGYIASRLIPRLLQAGYHVRCLARQPERLRRRAWYGQVETAAGNLTRPETLPAAFQGVQACYYLVHSMAAGHGYEELDLLAARNFAQAARQAGVEQIIYLGGLADERERLAGHLRSRIESGAALSEAGVPVTEFRAGVIVGPGSVSFEMIRFIAEQFPVMVGPAWLKHKSQPIATRNVLDYMVAALETPACYGKIIEIGGEDTMTYAESMTRFAQLRGHRRSLLLLPMVPAWFMAFFIDKLTPVHNSYALPLVQGLKNDSLVLHPTPPELFPELHLLDYTQAVTHALADLHPDTVERTWLDLERDDIEIKHEGMFIAFVRVRSRASAQAVFAAVCGLGGSNGWPAWNGLWQLRGLLDRLFGGPGMRGRDEQLRQGGLLDFYRVEMLIDGRLRLRAELKAPGLAWMEWLVLPGCDGKDGCTLEQTAFFAPKGLPGFLYWYLLSPIHRAVFKRLAQGLAGQAEKI